MRTDWSRPWPCSTNAVVVLLLASLSPFAKAGAEVRRSTDWTRSEQTPSCRYLPGDPGWPDEADWDGLNRTVGGRLVRGHPRAQICFGSNYNSSACSSLQEIWDSVTPYLDDPVNVMSPYWLNDSCNPFSGPNGSCTLGNMASYAIDVADADTAIAGIRFAQEKNIRLSIKNTGHDYLGRSTGEGSLALWTHNLRNMSFFNYTSTNYTGPAAKVGAGVATSDVYEAGQSHGLRVVGGGCPTVGPAGGWLPGGGHGPLTAAYGLGADEVLEYEVVTSTGQHLVASPDGQYSDLYWALSGGGSGNYAVVLSLTLKAHTDGPVAGMTLTFANTNPDTYWSAITAWIKQLFEIDATFPAFNSATTFTSQGLALDYITWPDATEADLLSAMGPYLDQLEELNITFSQNSNVLPTFYDHYQYYTTASTVKETISNRLIPRSLVQENLTALIDTIRGIADNNSAAAFVIVGNNVTHGKVGNAAGSNSVLPAWRDSLFLLNFGLELAPDATWDTISAHQAEVGEWMDAFRALTPGGGSYLNEAMFGDAWWKEDYFGSNYNRLAEIKAKYDPDYLLFANAAVGSDVVWKASEDGSGRLCRRT